MDLERRPSGSSAAAAAALALCLACSSSENSAESAEGSLDTSDTTATGGPTATGPAGTTNSDTMATTAAAESAQTSGAVGTTSSEATASGDGDGGTAGTDGSVGAGGTDTDGSATSSDLTGSGGSSGGAGGTGTTNAVTTSTTGGVPSDAAPSAGCEMPAGLESGRASIDVDGKTREYILEVPDNYDPSHPYKLIFGWHPWGGSAEQIANMGYFGLSSVSDGQAILVAPEGQEYQDRGLGWGNEGGEDIDFLHAMVERFGSELCIDENRIFSTGFSFGAMFSFTLGCAQDGMMRAIAPQAGNAMTSGPCEDGPRSVATLAFIGTDDSLLDGHREAVQIFVERNECSPEAVTLEKSWCDGLDAEFQPCTCVEYPDCKDGYPVIACEYTAGHQFAPDAGQTLWNFFAQF